VTDSFDRESSHSVEQTFTVADVSFMVARLETAVGRLKGRTSRRGKGRTNRKGGAEAPPWERTNFRTPLSPAHAGSATFSSVLFERHLAWQKKATIRSLRFGLFTTPGILAQHAGKTTIKLAVPPRERDWSSRLWEKILCRFPNCNAVENRPVFCS
jgi:hypothetical protein